MNPDDIRAVIENGMTFNLQDNFKVNEPSFITDNPEYNTSWSNINVNTGYKNDYTYHSEKRLLHIATESGNIAAVQILLNSGADPNIPIRHFTINTVTTPTGYTYKETSERGVTKANVFAKSMRETLQQMINRLSPVAQISQESATPVPQESAAPLPQVNTMLQTEAKAELIEPLEQQMREIDLSKSKGEEESEYDEPKKKELPSSRLEKWEAEYDADSETHGKKRRLRERLILGEANFSYTKSVIKKHERDLPELPTFITATEIRSAEVLRETYSDYEENIKYITNKKATVKLGVDAKNIKKSFPGKRFERIHFNAPYLKNQDQTRSLVSAFFASASEAQEEGDRICISLVDDNQYFHHGYTYGIIEASAQEGYQLLTKRKFGEDRYVGYKHRETAQDSSSKNAQYLKEFVFEKTTLAQIDIETKYRELGIYNVDSQYKGAQTFFLKNKDNPNTPYDTADDSSDYFTERSPDQAQKIDEKNLIPSVSSSAEDSALPAFLPPPKLGCPNLREGTKEKSVSQGKEKMYTKSVRRIQEALEEQSLNLEAIYTKNPSLRPNAGENKGMLWYLALDADNRQEKSFKRIHNSLKRGVSEEKIIGDAIEAITAVQDELDIPQRLPAEQSSGLSQMGYFSRSKEEEKEEEAKKESPRLAPG